MGGSSKKAKQQVTDYNLSLHYGVCHGPVDALKEIWIGEKLLWQGYASEGISNVYINAGDILGGNLKEGGYRGYVTAMMGAASQVVPAGIAAKMAAVNRVPGFRGVLSLFFWDGGSGGFYWGSNSGYIRDVWAKVFRSPKGFYPAKATIPRPGQSDLDANPAHMIWECSTDTDWGSGVTPAMIDILSMTAAADQLHAEGFGLSMIWSGQQAVDEFVNQILTHIDATFEINPRTGLYTLNLIRGDYSTNDLPELTPDNFKLTSFSRRAWEETINEVNVTWTNPITENEETVTYHDLGNIAQQGGNIISETLEYPGIRTSVLAMRVAQRESVRRGSPLAAIEGVANRIAWDWMPGDVVLLTWPKYNIYKLPVRVGTVDRGAPGDPGITITAVEDVFALPDNAYSIPPGSEWEDTSSKPFPLTLVQPVSIPYFMAAQDQGGDAAAAVEYPDTYVAVMAAAEVNDAYGFQLYTKGVDFAGNAAYLDLGPKSMTPYSLLPQALVKEANSLMGRFVTSYGAATLRPGVILWVGTEGENHEIMVVTAVSDVGNISLQRGGLDTVPRAWPAGTQVWHYDPSLAIEDPTLRIDEQQITYRLLTKTSVGRLGLEEAPDVAYVAESRMSLPYRPANVRIWGAMWPGVVAGYAPATTVSWANRNRHFELDQVFGWDYGTVAPEPGSSVTLEVLNTDGSLIERFEGLTSASQDIDLTSVTGPSAGIRIWSERDELRSYQFDEHTFDVAGYGQNYGNYYGGYGA
ncbi:hypothetical protein GOD54_23635 [Sinorhizobium medicae]|nr:hypothetical protein [Sinorhizobium medicae]